MVSKDLDPESHMGFLLMNYQKVYDQIIERAQKETESRKKHKKEGGYYEGHHIIPHCVGGRGSSKDWDHPNIVPLTAREHFICHWLIARETNHPKLWFSFNRMCKKGSGNQQRYVPSSRVFEEVRIEVSKHIRKLHTGRKRDPEVGKKISRANTGKRRSKETVAKIKKALLKRTQETFDKIAEGNKGKKVSRETLNKIRATRIEKGLNEFTPKHKENIRKSAQKRVKNPQFIKTLKQACTGIPKSKEHRRKLAKAKGTAVVFRGVCYESYKECSNTTGITVYYIKKELKEK